ncbi:hypothetical protein [Natrinema pallidum]|uniref:hypothetical protein n=1 Tax=Natrinema pallidum TaxID=69527 RepID=UPI000A9EF4C9|nr:hypothetical protein [Natrinema pallidum]
MVEECALCKQEKELMDSHIIPNFVIRWLKKSAATPFLRTAENPDTRIQDYKEPMLCHDCEQIFSDWEGKFAGGVFYPHIRNQQEKFEYDSWLKKFIISISWRILEADRTSLDMLDDDSKKTVDQVKEEWRDLLIGNSTLTEEERDHHIFFLGDMESPAEDVPDKWEFYSDRGIDATIVDFEGKIHLYFKFPQMLFVSCISPSSIDGFRGTKVSDEGSVEVPQEILNKDWGTFLFNRADLITTDLSDDESEKIIDRMLDNPEEVIESESFQTFQKERNRKIESHRSTDYLGQECPVCGVEHIQFDSLGEKPLTKSGIKALEQSDGIERAEGVLMLPGNEFGLSTTKDVTGAVILVLPETTYLINLYTDHGWGVDRAFPHPKQMDEENLDEHVNMLVSEFEEYYRENVLPG